MQATTITRVIWNVAAISQGVCAGCTLDLNRVLSDPAMQTIIGGAMPIIKRGEERGFLRARSAF